ncbi:MAG: trehalose-6-phosphate synthase [Devosiaceae bacterium]
MVDQTSRLVVVSNRVGPLVSGGKAGGLAVAMADALQERGGVWFGWSGNLTDSGTWAPIQSEVHGEGSIAITLATLDMTQQDYAQFYEGFANRVLWPLLHYRTDLIEYDPSEEEGYRRVNQRFATRLAALVEPSDLIWVQDYHYLTFAQQLRMADVQNRIGFFLHIPFPPPDVFNVLPGADSIVRALLAYDVLGFQTQRDADNMIALLEAEGGARVDRTTVELMGRRITVKAFPISINAQEFAELAVSQEAQIAQARAEQLLHGRQQIIGVDRIDYSKGLPERFQGFKKLLENYPENSGRVSFLQIAPPSRGTLDAYVRIREDLEQISGHVNGRFGDIDWVPIRFTTRGQSRSALAGLYRASRVGLVTPLRDGMNLVAKEYIAAQNPDDPGVLVLSQFAGAAEQMSEAIIVNPYSDGDLAEGIQTALRMEKSERIDRYQALMEMLLENDVNAWRRSYIAALQR